MISLLARFAAVLILFCMGGIAAALLIAPLTEGDVVAFTSERDGNSEIYLLDVGRGTLRNLTQNPYNDYFSVWSLDGEQIAFVTDRDGGDGEIYRMNADGGGTRRLTFHNGSDITPAWSPDGTQIAFASVRDYNYDYDLFIMDTDGQNVRFLVQNVIDDVLPTWSPDGSQIAFVSEGNEIQVISTSEIGAQVPQMILSHSSGIYGLDWSPDGSRLTFALRTNTGFSNLYLLPIATPLENLTQISPLIISSTNDASPRWSSDGKSLIFTSAENGNEDIYVIDLTTLHRRRLTHHPAHDYAPAWRP